MTFRCPPLRPAGVLVVNDKGMSVRLGVGPRVALRQMGIIPRQVIVPVRERLGIVRRPDDQPQHRTDAA